MPELPEVETIRRELTAKLIGKKIIAVTVNKPNVIKEPSPSRFKKQIVNQTIKKIIRRAKLLIIEFRSGKFLVVHLRISGWLLYGECEPRARVSFKLSGGKCLNYMDQRLLGELRLRKSYEDLKFIKTLGPEPDEMGLAAFKAVLKKKKTKIKALLLDQTVIAGIGNIYAQEALFMAKIDPRRQADSLREKEFKTLHLKIKSVLKTAIKYRGSSVDSYRDLSGECGGMEKRLKVYARKGKPCSSCGRPLKKIALAGRGTCFCPHCQV